MSLPSLEGFQMDAQGLYKLWDRFSFDRLFRLLLSKGFEHEDILNFVLNNCSLSATVFQERIHNKYYLSLSVEDTISDDLLALSNECFLEIISKGMWTTPGKHEGR